jgi:type I restriction enzyme S subunit
VNDLPATWRWATIDEIAGGMKSNVVIGPFGSSLKVSDYKDSGVPLVFVRNIRTRDFSGSGTRFVSPDKALELRAHEVRPGDVLITKMGDPPGDAAVYPDLPAALVTADCIRLRPGPTVEAKFLAYAFEAAVVRQQFQEITRGVAQQKVSLARFRQGVAIPLPPLHEQRRIVDLLEDHLSRLDAATVGAQRAHLRLDGLEQSVLSECYQIGQLLPLGSLAAIQGGIQKQPKRAPAGNSFPFLRVANVTARGLDLKDVHRVELFDGELEKLRLRDGDLLVVEGNGSPSQIGRAAVWNGEIEDCVHQNHLIRVRPAPGLSPLYLEAIWNAPQNRRQLTDLSSSSSGLHTLSVGKLKALKIPVADETAQRDVLARVVQIRAARQRLQADLTVAFARGVRLRQALLAAAFSGQLTNAASSPEGLHV